MYIEDLVGKTFIKIEQIGNEEIYFYTDDGCKYLMNHYQDCCECVYIEDIVGNLEDLVGTPIIMAEEISEIDNEASESGTWTFYKFATTKGYVTIRWYGSSNGYYSESVSFAMC
jgi:hypothetical protein